MAIEAYVTGGASQSLSVALNGSQQTEGMQQAYIQAASGNLDESETTVLINQRSLSLERATLNKTEQIAQANAVAISEDLSQEKAVTAELVNEQAQVKGQLAAAVAAVQRAQAAAYAAELAAAAKKAAAEEAAAKQSDPPPAPAPVVPAVTVSQAPAQPATVSSTPSHACADDRGQRRPDRSKCGAEPKRRPLCVGWGDSRRRVRLLGPDHVGVGASRRLSGPRCDRAVLRDPTRLDGRPPAR